MKINLKWLSLIILVPIFVLFQNLSSPPPNNTPAPNFDNIFLNNDLFARSAISKTGSSKTNSIIINDPNPAVIGATNGNKCFIEHPEYDHTNYTPAPNEKICQLAIESQSSALEIIQDGVFKNNTATINIGLLALEWGFSPLVAGPNGDWPQERLSHPGKFRNLHPKSVFLFSASRALNFLKASPYGADPNFSMRIKNLTKRVLKSADAMVRLNIAETRGFVFGDYNSYQGAKQTNQVLFIVAAIRAAGVLTGQQYINDFAEEFFKKVKEKADFFKNDPNMYGTLPEGNETVYAGFDSSYQTVSLELLGYYYSTLRSQILKDAVRPYLERGLNKYLTVIDDNGVIDTSSNTRTKPCGAPIVYPNDDGLTPKGRDIDTAASRLRYLGHLLNRSSQLIPIAIKVQKIGQGFDHIEETCL